jgi:hypothetical protein
MSLEDTFLQWSKPASDTEETRCENASSAIDKAMRASEYLQYRDLSIFGQGSYAANTNVRQDSDVDVCVMCKDTFFFELPSGAQTSEYSIAAPAEYTFERYKNEVHSALIARFGDDGVTRGGKAFDVHSNSYRVDADAVPTFEFRRYFGPPDQGYVSGVAFIDEKSGRRIHNYPVHALANGRAKSVDTGRRYKKVVRILKRLRNLLRDEGSVVSQRVPSFLIECLVYRVSNSNFQNSTLTADVHDVLYYLLGDLATDQSCNDWTETNQIKYLFRSSQPWTRADASTFVWEAIDRLKI